MPDFYVIVKAAPAVTSRTVPQEFLESFEALEPGEGFNFPLNPDLKDPMASFRHRGRQRAGKGARYRWVLTADLLGDPIGTVYRIK